MALIGKIRSKNWILIFLIGLGLASFIMMDSFSGDKSIGATSGTTLGKIAGTKISYPEFDRLYQVRSNNFQSSDSHGQRASLWNYLVEKSILKSEGDALGLGVSNQELRDLQFSSNPANLSPLMAQRFPSANSQQWNPQPDLQRIEQLKGLIDKGSDDMDKQSQEYEQYKNIESFWKMHEDEVRKERVQAKLNTLVSKSLYTPNWMIEKAYADQNQRISFNYVKIPFDQIDNSEVKVEDADLTNYLNANIAKYTQDEETRKLGYVTFDVVASAKDSADIKTEVVEIGNEFAKITTTEDIAYFVDNNDGRLGQGWVDAETLNEAIKGSAFSQPLGSVTAPYFEGRAYEVAKIIDRRILPDSAKCRHILLGDRNLQRGQTPRESQYVAWQKTADSLITLLESGQANFDSLVVKYSTDQGSVSKGGVYDYAPVNQYVPEFNDVVFFSGDLNKLYAVRTAFGIHIIEPLGRKNITNTERVKIAFLSKAIIPSRKTTKAKYSEATNFIRKNKTIEAVKAAATAANLKYATSNPLKVNDYNIQGLGANDVSRKIVKFAFEKSLGTVSANVYSFQDPVDFYDNKYVIAVVESIRPAGKPSLDQVREDILPIVRNIKKGEIIKGKINSQDLFSIASTFGTQVDTATTVSFSAATVPGLGAEPKIVAAAFGLNQGAVSSPIVGENGVYVVQNTLKPSSPAPSNIAAIRKTIRQASQNQVQSALMQGMKKGADISDYRAKFF